MKKGPLVSRRPFSLAEVAQSYQPDPIYRRLKSRAASEGRPAKELILRGIESILKEGPRKPRRTLKLPLIRSKQPGTLDIDNAKIFKLIPFP